MHKNKKKKPSILVIGAHNDDFAIGAGGTLLKYLDEGYHVASLIASFGEKSHPHIKPEIIAKQREKEAKRVSKFMNIEHLGIVGAKEGKFLRDENPRLLHDAIKNAILKLKPEKIFIHSIDDPHPDHRALYKITLDVADEINYQGDIYSYDIWNPLSFKKQGVRMVVDITPYFWKKLAAIKRFDSQWIALVQLIPATIYRAIRNGLRNSCRFAEVFYKVR